MQSGHSVASMFPVRASVSVAKGSSVWERSELGIEAGDGLGINPGCVPFPLPLLCY